MRHRGSRVLKTERLVLRPFCVSDAEEMFFGWASDPEVTRFMTWTPHGDIETTRRKAFRLPSTGEREDVVVRGILREDYFTQK